ncbi:MAG TPA: hypothetical protein VF805_04885 [Anaeromyxobacteraceae bacterium]
MARCKIAQPRNAPLSRAPAECTSAARSTGDEARAGRRAAGATARADPDLDPDLDLDVDLNVDLNVDR